MKTETKNISGYARVLHKQSTKRHTGFTLVEVIAVILIITVLLAFIDGASTAIRRTARSDETRKIMSIVRKAAIVYRNSGKPWPEGNGDEESSGHLLAALENEADARAVLEHLPLKAIAATSQGRYLIDCFGVAIRYNRRGSAIGSLPTIVSMGADLQDISDNMMLELEQTRTFK